MPESAVIGSGQPQRVSHSRTSSVLPRAAWCSDSELEMSAGRTASRSIPNNRRRTTWLSAVVVFENGLTRLAALASRSGKTGFNVQ